MERMKHVSEIGLMKKMLREAKASVVTPQRQKLLDTAAIIRLDPANADRAFMARYLVQCTLPHSDPGKVPLWKRRNGNLTLSIVPGTNRDTGESFGYPYGSIPRLLLFWIVTEAVRLKSRRLELGSSLTEFIRAVGLDPNTGGGKRGDATRLRQQMVRLFRAIISFQVTVDDPHRHGQSWLDMQVAPKGELWWDPHHPEQEPLWGSWIELGEDFYKAIVSSTVPMDMRALRALKRSPLALDLYAWASYKAWVVNSKNTPQFIPWRGLVEQLGADYDPKRIDHFKEKVKATFRKVSAVFPGGLYLKWDRDGLTFLPGTKPAVGPRPQPKKAVPNYDSAK